MILPDINLNIPRIIYTKETQYKCDCCRIIDWDATKQTYLDAGTDPVVAEALIKRLKNKNKKDSQ